MQGQMRQEGRVMTSATQLLWELVLQELQRAWVMALDERPNWNHVKRVQWRVRVGLKASEHCKSIQGMTMRARVMAMVEHPSWNHIKRMQWIMRVGLKALERRKSAQGWTIN
jgi:hypothetical protein